LRAAQIVDGMEKPSKELKNSFLLLEILDQYI